MVIYADYRGQIGLFLYNECMKDYVWSAGDPVGQWFLTFLMLQPFNTVTHAAVTPNHKFFFTATS
jgi:dUTPase